MAVNAKSLLKWNPVTAPAFALADHFGVVNKAEQVLGGGPASAGMTPGQVTAPPTLDAPSMAAVAERRARRSLLTSPARNGTMLTGPSGLATPAPTQRKTLLGG
jgi:hypothetical protein